MSKNGRQHDIITITDSKSSIFEKTDATFREQINRAIVNRDPPTYQAVFEKFELAARDISFTAFYYYARRIRNTAALVEIIRARPEGAPDADAVLSEVLAERLLEAAIDESASPRAIERLSHAYRAAARLKLDRRRLDAQLDEEQDWVVDSGYNGTSWYQMDDVGNRESHRYRYNSGGGPTAYDMTYDKANRMTAIDSQAQSYDAAGNQLTGHSVNRDLAYVYHYDHHNRLTGVYDATDTTRKAAFTLDVTGGRAADCTPVQGERHAFAVTSRVYLGRPGP